MEEGWGRRRGNFIMKVTCGVGKINIRSVNSSGRVTEVIHVTLCRSMRSNPDYKNILARPGFGTNYSVRVFQSCN